MPYYSYLDPVTNQKIEDELKRQKDCIDWTLLIIIDVWLLYIIITTIMKKRR